jgi:hypothetical protein
LGISKGQPAAHVPAAAAKPIKGKLKGGRGKNHQALLKAKGKFLKNRPQGKRNNKKTLGSVPGKRVLGSELKSTNDLGEEN